MMVLKSKLSALVFGKDQEVAPLTSDSEAIELAPTAPLVPPPSHPGHAVTYLGKVRLFPAPALGPSCTDRAVQEMWALKAEEPNLARPARLEIRPFHIRMHVQLPPSQASSAASSAASCERAKPAGEEDPEDDDENEEDDENDEGEEEEEGGVATAAVRAQRLLWRKKRRGGGRGGGGGGAEEQRRRRRRRQPREGGGWRTDSFDVARVAFCSAEHRASGLVFAWLYREHRGGAGGGGAGGGGPALSCHAVECQSAEQAKRLAHTMMEAFTRTLHGMHRGGGGGGGDGAAAGEGWQVATATAGGVVGGGGGAEDLKVSVDTGSGCFGVRS
uniref:PTB-containing, cubilin and LRP1-interacting protein n=1 Tax=Petromyzon marinus TaxID=7757 RepID=A0AAJ7U348_PETMA|nr:PTB-containing, cubilin and LRP1-interacting protein [Petromyzon marinus]